MSTDEALKGWSINGVEIKPEEMSQDFKNFAIVFCRVAYSVLERHLRGEIDLSADLEKFKAEQANKSKDGIACSKKLEGKDLPTSEFVTNIIISNS